MSRKVKVWAFTTYFAEGFPYTIIRQLSSLFLRDRNIPLDSIGLTSLFGLPWILKFLWAPLLDQYGTKRKWMLLMQGVLTALFAATAAVSPLPNAPVIISVLFFTASFFAATHDTAIDGYYLEALTTKEQSEFVGFRVMSYRIAMIFGTGVIGSVGTICGWFYGFTVAAVVFGGVTLFHRFFLDEPESEKLKMALLPRSLANPKVLFQAVGATMGVVLIRMLYTSQLHESLRETVPFLKKVYFSHWITLLLLAGLFFLFIFRNSIKKHLETRSDSYYGRAFLTFIDRPKMGVIFASIIFLRTGEFMLSSMVAPFFVDLGIKVHYSWISSTIGLLLSIAGALAGGYMIKRFSLKRVLWPFLLLQNLTNIVYMFLATYLTHWLTVNTGAETVQFMGWGNLSFVAAVHGFDQFAGGLGTAVLMTLLMRLCLESHKAAHYAIGTAFMSISGVFAGIFGGVLAEALGYSWFFGISFLVSIPGMAAVLFLPNTVLQDQ